jgi:uncharacterized membrane protein
LENPLGSLDFSNIGEIFTIIGRVFGGVIGLLILIIIIWKVIQSMRARKAEESAGNEDEGNPRTSSERNTL